MISPAISALEKHYSVSEVAELWAISAKSVQRMFQDEPGVLKLSAPSLVKRKRAPKTMLRIPASVLARFHEQRTRGFGLKVQGRRGGVK